MITLVDGIEMDKYFSFPDGQPHIKLVVPSAEEHTITCSIRNPEELMNILLINNILRRDEKCKYVYLKVGYMLGARMDRALDEFQPFTMEVVADMLNTAKFNEIEVFNVHSEVTTKLLRAKNRLPHDIVKQIPIKQNYILPIAPDKGAQEWVSSVVGYSYNSEKDRESQTGKLLNFRVLAPGAVVDRHVIIIDDICDGGGTFVGLAKELRRCGAKRVDLYVSHGIFSKGFNLEGIDKIYTTNSYKDIYPERFTVFDVFSGERIQNGL